MACSTTASLDDALFDVNNATPAFLPVYHANDPCNNAGVEALCSNNDDPIDTPNSHITIIPTSMTTKSVMEDRADDVQITPPREDNRTNDKSINSTVREGLS